MKRTAMRSCCLLILASFLLVLIPFAVADAAEQSIGDSLTRGSRFTVTITGQPNTTYYVWLTGTSTMSGEPYDQPPVIAAGTQNVVKDPDGGPYTIGSYQYNNGNGRTILDDVTPSTANMSNTNYYAQVTTDATGTALVLFQTSIYTATRHYSVKSENPSNPESENYAVQEKVYSRGSKPMINTPAETVVTYPPRPSLTSSPAATAEESIVTTTPLPTTTIPPTPSPTKKSPLAPFALFAAITGLAAFLRR